MKQHRKTSEHQFNLRELGPVENVDLKKRLDQNIPVETEEWRKVEQLINYLTEFAPTYKLVELANAIGCFGDDQARRGYQIGRKELLEELDKEVA